jgi:flagellar biosynthesis/type III secretory pathway protein FliH
MLAERVRQWTEDWKSEGLKEGEKKGRKEGRKEGQAALLQLLLLQRFGNMLDQDVQERLTHATSEQLETWGRRILDARSIDEVFEE